MPADPAAMADAAMVDAAMVDALEQTLRSSHALASGFDAAAWELPTDCPGWSVRDQVSHLIDVEQRLMGQAPPGAPPAGLPRLRHDIARTLEIGVELRRRRPGEQVLAEFGETIERRISGLRETVASGADPELETIVFGRRPLSWLLPRRVFDAWAHEQDIRRAVKQPGNLDGLAAVVSHRAIVRVLPDAVRQGGLPPGAAIAFEVTGPLQIHQTVGDGEPTITVRTDWETFLRLVCGRVGPDERPPVEAAGDPALVALALASLAVTP